MSTTPGLPAPLQPLPLSPTTRTSEHYLVRPSGEDPFDLDAPYQRGAVWTDEQRRNLIRSLLLNLPIGAVTLAFQGYDTETTWRVIDGQQRIRTLRAWFNGELAVPGHWFPARWLCDGEAARHGDVTYGELTREGQRNVERWPVPTVEMDATRRWIPRDTPAVDGRRWDVQRVTDPNERLADEAEVYLLMNFGGVDQTDEDRARATDVAARRLGVVEIDEPWVTVMVGTAGDPDDRFRGIDAHEVLADGEVIGFVHELPGGLWGAYPFNTPDGPVVAAADEARSPEVAAQLLARRVGR